MLDKLELIEKRFEEVTLKLSDPTVISDPDQYRALSIEHSNLSPIVEKFAEYKAAKDANTEARSLLDEGGLDPDLKEIAAEQLEESAAQIEALEKIYVFSFSQRIQTTIKMLLWKSVVVLEEEAALFANSLYRMYSMYAESQHWKIEILNLNATELGGIKEISFSITGQGAYSRLKFESGVHRVQRVPETESQGRVHTSTVTVAVLPEAEEVDFQIDPADLQIDTFRSSGAGGQHINKTESAIRITHLPTGVVVECQDERSQYKNKEKAMKVLRSRLLEAKIAEQNAAIAADRRAQVGTGDRSERIRTYNYPQGRLTDHRIGYTSYQLANNLNGDLDDLLDALMTADQAAKLAAADI